MIALNFKIDQTFMDRIDELGLLVGNTPLIPLHRVTEGISERVKVCAKAEWVNLSGSIKARPMLNIIRSALENGELIDGRRLLDSTSGNAGIAYATFGAALGIPVTLTIPQNASKERITILQAMGVDLIFTDPLEGSDGAILAARRLASENPEMYFYANQYDNPANWLAHFRSTGPEIISQTGGKVTHFVAGMGTSGTLTGVGRALREVIPDIELIAVQPDSAFHGLEGLKYMSTSIQPKIYDPSVADDVLMVETEEAHEMVRRLAREEGLFVGISSGANVVAAIKVARKLHRGTVVTVFPDSGYKYLSDKRLWGPA
jgi:cysteine synthase B